VVRAQSLQFVDCHSMTHKKYRQVADNFARWSYFYDVAERHVDLSVSAGDLRPFVPETHRFGLFLEIGVLAARHFVEIHFGGAGFGAAIERQIVLANDLPIIGALIHAVEVEARVAFRVG
jgi:hypothetical protein